MTRYKDRKRNALELICRIYRRQPKCCRLPSSMRLSQRKTEAPIEQQGSTQSAKRDTSVPSEVAAAVATILEAPTADELARNTDYSDVFGQFQSQQVEVPVEKRLVCLTDSESLAAEKFRFLGDPSATFEAGSAAQESTDYQHDSPRGQEHGFCQLGLFSRSKNTAEDFAD